VEKWITFAPESVGYAFLEQKTLCAALLRTDILVCKAKERMLKVLSSSNLGRTG
jgi:hypothetical protein